MKYLNCALAVLAVCGIATTGNADPTITFDAAHTATDGHVSMTSVGTSLLTGNPPPVNSPPNPKFNLLPSFHPSQGSPADWGNETFSEATTPDGSVDTTADAQGLIYGSGTNVLTLNSVTIAQASTSQPGSNYSGNADASLTLELFSTINGLIPGQLYTLHCDLLVEYQASFGKTETDSSFTHSKISTYVGDPNSLTEIFDVQTDDGDILNNGLINLEDAAFDLIDFTATGASMDLWIQVEQDSQVHPNGPAGKDDQVDAKFISFTDFSIVPEPSSLCSFCIGASLLLGFLFIRRREQMMPHGLNVI